MKATLERETDVSMLILRDLHKEQLRLCRITRHMARAAASRLNAQEMMELLFSLKYELFCKEATVICGYCSAVEQAQYELEEE